MKEYDFKGKGRCLECGSKMEYGRSDKKFCCPHCKNLYNNRAKINLRSMKVKVDGTLSRNYRILSGLVRAGVSEMPMDQILAMDFNPSFVTGHIRVAKHTVLSCYDISFIISDTRIFNIQRISVNSRRSNNF